ncbi:MAG TPA: fatty acid desaturase CarF family protein [Polyangiaceae bacterium]|nr:fatty acid desaturase CarF family protein [Polyangiaceae bacterium]
MTPQSPLLSLFKATGVAVASVLYLALFQRGVLAMLHLEGVWLAIVGFLLGYLLADLGSGVVHWFCDTFCSENTPLIGRILIQPFREHHEVPEQIAECRFIEQDTGNFFILIPLLGGLLLQEVTGGAELLGCWVALGLCLGSFVANSAHKWAHDRHAPRAARVLQRLGLIISPKRHALHHHTHDRSYCITTGWLNAPLDALGLFPRLERMIRRMQQ